jgi:hypothetical protein
VQNLEEEMKLLDEISAMVPQRLAPLCFTTSIAANLSFLKNKDSIYKAPGSTTQDQPSETKEENLHPIITTEKPTNDAKCCIVI